MLIITVNNEIAEEIKDPPIKSQEYGPHSSPLFVSELLQ